MAHFDRLDSPAHILLSLPRAATTTLGTQKARITIIFQPGGFDIYLSELLAMAEGERAAPAPMNALNQKHDFIMTGLVPHRAG